ncbi:hypothetical protein H6771_00030 [Candidatus Peribacteria bacterium]|nr:hypothetical protein [Candidatus Peribacteria bacterium]
MHTLLLGIVVILGLRTGLWWVQLWQIKEYRVDRLRDYFHSEEGRRSMRSLCFFPGVLPRPEPTLRALLVVLLTGILSLLAYRALSPVWGALLTALVIERTLWLWTGIAVALTGVVKTVQQRLLFAQVRRLREGAGNLTIIAITGSYGKTSTRAMLAHVLTAHFGQDDVLSPQGNRNTELGIAQWLWQERDYFTRGDKRYLVVEVGAYQRGEIATVCRFLQPQIGIITAMSNQHMALFRTQRNLQLAKAELAEGCSDVCFYNGEDVLSAQILRETNTSATLTPLPTGRMTSIEALLGHTEFTYDGQHGSLPWPGQQYMLNVRYVLAVCEYLSVPLPEALQALRSAPQPLQGLHAEQLTTGATLLWDTYNANEQGVLAALQHMELSRGEKVVILQHLRELGPEADRVHERIFQKLHAMDATLYWRKELYYPLAKRLLGQRCQPYDQAVVSAHLRRLGADDVVFLATNKAPDIEAHVKSH